MDEPTNDQRPRASLRGKGREILLGQRSGAEFSSEPEGEQKPSRPASTSRPDFIDPASLPLSPEEAAALLDFSPDSPAYDTAAPLPAAPAEPVPASEPEPEPEPLADYDDSLFDMGTPPEKGESFDEDELPDWLKPTSLEEPLPVPDWMSDSGPDLEAPGPRAGDAVPLAERGAGEVLTDEEAAYEPPAVVDELTPDAPEEWEAPPAEPEPSAVPPVLLRRARRESAPLDDGGQMVEDEVLASEQAPASSGLPDPFVSPPPRQASDVLFESTATPDQSLLAMLVDDDRIRKLSQQIEALQDDLVQQVESDRSASDLYMDELLRASSLLMASRENYDDARAIVYRIRADMNRQRKVSADISRYRPLLLNYYVGWGIALIVLFLLKSLFTGVTDAVGVGVVSALYYPMLLGVSGALISGYLTLERHTTRLRDFDPIHISWYLFNPLLGGVMGLLMFLIASIANEDLLRDSATEAEYAITYLLCVVAGMNQNNVLRQLNDLLKRFGRGGGQGGQR